MKRSQLSDPRPLRQHLAPACTAAGPTCSLLPAADAPADSSDIKASVAALAFVLRRYPTPPKNFLCLILPHLPALRSRLDWGRLRLRSAAKFDVEDSTLSNELQQLGLPKEHADELCRPYQSKKESLRTRLAKESLRCVCLGWPWGPMPLPHASAFCSLPSALCSLPPSALWVPGVPPPSSLT